MHIELEKPSYLPSVTLGCIIIVRGKTSDDTKHYMIVKRTTTYSVLHLESYKLAYLDQKSPEAILENIARLHDIIEVISPAQTILSRKDVS